MRNNTDGHEKQTCKSFVHDIEVYLDEQEGSANNLDYDLQDKDEDCAVTIKIGRSVCSVVIAYRDITHIVNRFPGNPIHPRPFNNCFSRMNINITWIAVGFLPMTRNAVNDPKVRYELGEGGAPEEDLGRMEMLVSEYEEAGTLLSRLGFDGGMFDIKPRVAEKIVAPETDKATVQAIIDNEAINRPGGMFKLGILVANCGMVMEAEKRI